MATIAPITMGAMPQTLAPNVNYVGSIQAPMGAPVVGSISAPMGGAAYTLAAPAATTTITAAPTTARMTVSNSTQALGTSTVMQQTPSYVTSPQVFQAPQITQQAPQIIQAPQAQVAMQSPPSYVPQQVPQVIQSASAANLMRPMQAPEILTTGIPSPQQIQVQKDAYAGALDKQLADGISTIQKETEIEKQMVDFNFRKQKAIMELQIEEQRNEQLALLDEQATFRQCELKKAYVERKLQLDNQSNGLLLDYNMRAVQTELAVKQYEFQQNYIKTEGDLERQYAAAEKRAHTGTTYADPAMAVKR